MKYLKLHESFSDRDRTRLQSQMTDIIEELSLELEHYFPPGNWIVSDLFDMEGIEDMPPQIPILEIHAKLPKNPSGYFEKTLQVRFYDRPIDYDEPVIIFRIKEFWVSKNGPSGSIGTSKRPKKLGDILLSEWDEKSPELFENIKKELES